MSSWMKSRFKICRMIKEAKKEKGTDDFLGNIVLQLQVIKDPIDKL